MTRTIKTLSIAAALTAGGLFASTASGECFCDRNADGVTDSIDLLDYLAAWFSQDAETDLNHDGVIDVFDLLDFLNCWFPGCPPVVAVPAGVSLVQSFGDISLPIPQDFFYPGCLPFEADVFLVGVPLPDSGPFELGSTDTMIEWRGPVEFPEFEFPSLPQPVAIEIVELNLQGVQPIQVQGQDWLMSMGLAPGGSEQGVLDAVRTSPDGGTYAATVPVRPILTFTRINDFPETRVLELEEFDLNIVGDFQLPAVFDTWDAPFVQQAPALELGVPMFGQATGNGMTLHFAPAQSDPTRPGANVHPDANVDPGVASLGRFAQIEQFATVGPGTVIGPNAVVQFSSQIGADTVIGRNAQIGFGAVIGNGVWIGDNTVIGPNTFVEDGAVIGSNCNIGPSAFVGFEARIGYGSAMGLGAQAMPGTTLGQFVTLEDQAFVDFNLRVASGGTVPFGANLLESMYPCLLANGIVSVETEQSCNSLDGELQGTLDDDGTPPPATTAGKVETDQIDDDALPAALQGLGTDVGSDIARPGLGGTGERYVNNGYDCENYADDLEQKLRGIMIRNPHPDAETDPDIPVLIRKYPSTTFTCVWDVNKTRRATDRRTPRLINGHCFTDVHVGNRTIWLEAQRRGNPGDDKASALDTNLDYDGDNKVEYATGPGTAATESGNGACKRIEVYPTFAACKAVRGCLDRPAGR